ncbi:BnaC09g12660D [Brassica napus]|uniref:BnaC09g12660D protein n=3 Tax=Brassica TaxID=3705 RepID=A0A078F1J0_BRANA|nr:BnaC09g12660D [Brassica napus]
MEFPHGLRLLHWKPYPSKCLPSTFHPEYLVELDMQHSQLEKLWEGTQPLANLTKMNLSGSWDLKEVPDLSNATNLELLDLSGCMSLVEIPSSISNLHKLQELMMMFCINLECDSSDSSDQRSQRVSLSQKKLDDKTQLKTSTDRAFCVKLSNAFSALDGEADTG